jgi:hydrogenase nickel incorporation protein HypB
VEVLQNLLSENDHQAAHNREHFDRYQLLAINLMSSPSSCKTRLLKNTIEKLGHKYRIGVVEGDLRRRTMPSVSGKKGW